MTTSHDDEGLTADTLERYFRAGVSTTHMLSNDPNCLLRIDPRAQSISLLTPASGELPTISGMKRVDVERLDLEDGARFCLTVDARDLHFEAYSLLLAIVQSLRAGQSFATAATTALAKLRGLLAARAKLSEEQQIGLAGELLVLRTLLHSHSEDDVLDWWLGPLAEQHDFALPSYDVEVKTTLSEQRNHLISGLSQLERTPGRPLWLVSVQLTRAGGALGLTLAGLVGEIREMLVVQRQRFLEHLSSLGWEDDDADLYSTEYLLRSRPLAYPVGDDFPALTADRLRDAVPHAELVSGVIYRVDVSAREPGHPGRPLDEFLNNEEIANE